MDRIWKYQSEEYINNIVKLLVPIGLLGLISPFFIVIFLFSTMFVGFWIPYKFFYNDFGACINSGISRKDFLKSTVKTILFFSILYGIIITVLAFLGKQIAILFKLDIIISLDTFTETTVLGMLYFSIRSSIQELLINSIYVLLCYKYGRKAFAIIAGLIIFSALGNMYGFEIIRVFNMIKNFLLFDDNILIQIAKSAVYFTILYQILKTQVLKLELN